MSLVSIIINYIVLLSLVSIHGVSDIPAWCSSMVLANFLLDSSVTIKLDGEILHFSALHNVISGIVKCARVSKKGIACNCKHSAKFFIFISLCRFSLVARHNIS